jgi:hypothetical protein
MDAEISGVPLGEVARELEAQTGIRVVLSDPASVGWLVSASVKGKSLAEGIKHILRGYSYAIYPVAGAAKPAVILLSTPRAFTGVVPVSHGLANRVVSQSMQGFQSLEEDILDAELEDEEIDPAQSTQRIAAQRGAIAARPGRVEVQSQTAAHGGDQRASWNARSMRYPGAN